MLLGMVMVMVSWHAGLSIRLYHPDSAPFDTVSFFDTSGSYNLRSHCIEVGQPLPLLRFLGSIVAPERPALRH